MRKGSDMAGCIYMIRNKANGKEYIGQTKHLSTRWSAHKTLTGLRCGKRCPVQEAILHEGLDNFDFIVLEDEVPDKMLKEVESRYIAERNTVEPNGYNLVGDGVISELTSEKLSKAARAGIEKMKDEGRLEEHMAMMREAHKRKGYSPMHPNTKEALMKSKGHRQEVRCVETGKVYPSITAAANAVGGRVSNMSTAIKKTGRYKGYSWETR